MKVTMADVRRTVKGVKIKEATPGLFFIQFAHELDMEAVLAGGPWSFNNQMLIIERVQLGVQIENIPLYHVDFWVQVHNLPTGLMAERVGKTLANYIGSFVEYDKNNKGSFWREYMRIKVRVDVRQPLKRESRVKNQGGEWCTVNFKYEKLGVFCLFCGIVGHGENKCSIRFSMETDDGIRPWSKDLRADPRRRGSRQSSRWLMEEDDGRSVREGSQAHVSGENEVDPTRHHNSANSSNQNRPTHHQQSLTGPIFVPSETQNRQGMTHAIIPLSMPASAITAHAENHENNRKLISQPVSNQSNPFPHLFPNNNIPDNTFIAQSLPNNSQTFTSLTYSPIITESLTQHPSHQFSFNSNPMPHPKPTANPINRTSKKNPTHNNSRTGPVITRTDPNPGPSKHVPTLNQFLPISMEAQTEKKRRRDNEQDTENTSNVTQHFLTAGPGSQACRDQ
jgi:hypothetical protein